MPSICRLFLTDKLRVHNIVACTVDSSVLQSRPAFPARMSVKAVLHEATVKKGLF